MFRRITNRILNNVEGVVIREVTNALTPHVKDAAEGIMNAVTNSKPPIRSTGGATDVYLTKVQSDFQDFHSEDANTDIQTFILELLQIVYEGKSGFEKSKVSDKVVFNIGNKTSSPLSNIKINNIAISGYKKSLNSATIMYRISIGFDVDVSRHEKLYEVEYTLQLRSEFGEQAFLECQNCGAPLEEQIGECTYCGMKHLRDTISNWVVTDCKEK
jgi:hypothetical protein